MFANKNWAYLILMIIAFSRVSFGFSMYILRLSYHMFFDKIFLTHVEVRVTTKKWDLKLGILHKGFGEACESKNQKKLKNFTPTQNAKFWYLWNGSLKFPQNLHQVGYPKKSLWTMIWIDVSSFTNHTWKLSLRDVSDPLCFLKSG